MKISGFRTHSVALALAGAITVSGCQMNQEQAQLLGTLVGGIAGAAVGSQFGDGSGRVVAVAIGTLAGSLIGHQLASYLTRQEQEQLYSTTQRALASASEQNSSARWVSPDGQKSADIQIASLGPVDDLIFEARQKQSLNEEIVSNLPADTICREATTNLDAGGTTVSETALWCRNADGDYVQVTS